MVGKYQTSAKDLASGLQAILCDTFDCSAASPFSNYTSDVEYYKQRDFGRVALATYAHYLFGHVDATAAITNDKAFVEGMLSINAEGDNETAGGAALRAAAWTKDTTPDVQSWSAASSGTDANLAIRLVKALVQKGLDGAGVPTVSSVNDNNLSETLASIVAQVVGQDASRLMDYDNSERTLDQHILLRFIAGDVIYMNIRLRAPLVNVGATNQQVLGSTLQNMYSEENFTIKITLGDSSVVPSERVFTSVIPDEDLSGNSVIEGTAGGGIHYFKFNFVAPSSSVNVFVKSNEYTPLEEIVIGLYQASSITYAPFLTVALDSQTDPVVPSLIDTPSNLTVLSGVTPPTQTDFMKFDANLNNLTSVPNFTLNSLVPGTTYSLLTRTDFNDIDNSEFGTDLEFAIEHNSINVPLTYVDYAPHPTD